MIDADIVYILIGKKIKEHRMNAKKSQADLAEAIEVSRASLANYESGNTSIYISDLYLIAYYLKKDINEFLPSIAEIQSATLPESRLDNAAEDIKKEIMNFIGTLNNKEGQDG